MSIGNLKSEGNKSNNFPFQLKVLQGLQCACDQLKAIGADTTAIEQTLLDIDTLLVAVEINTRGVERTPGIIRPTGPGNLNSIAVNLFSVSVANVGLADGTILGTTIRPGEVLNFSGDALNNFFTSFAYDATGTEFVIIFVS